MKHLSGCLMIVFVNVIVGGWSVNTILSFFGHDIPLYADVLIGLFTGQIAFPIAVIGKILMFFGVF